MKFPEFVPYTYAGSIAQYNISWRLEQDIAKTRHEWEKLSPTYIERHMKTVDLYFQIAFAVREK